MGAGISAYKPEKNLYAIACPANIRPNSEFSVIVSVHESDVPAKIKVVIGGPTLYIENIVEVQPYSLEVLSFQIPLIEDGRYFVCVTGLDGIIFKKKSNLKYSKYESFSLVQTDKATYKPGDLVRFRILILDKHTCPAKIEVPVSICIIDPQQNKIKEINNAQFISGVHSNELQLSQFPNLGLWKILVKYANESNSYNFEVDKYVLPKFEVTIDGPKHVLWTNGRVKFVVRAKYTFGKPLKGEAVLIIKKKYPYWREPNQNLTVLTKTTPLDGSASFEIDFDEEIGKTRGSNFKITASVEESLTGITQKATVEIVVHHERYNFKVDHFPTYFTEEAPLKLTVFANNFDETPVQDSINPVVVTFVPYAGWRPLSKKGEKEEEPEDELIEFTLKEKLDENGRASIIFIPPKSTVSGYNIMVKYLGKEVDLAYVGHKIRSGKFFELETQTEKPQLNMEVSMKVISDLPLKYLFYQIVARGDIVAAGKIDVPENATEHVFKFQTTFTMVPFCHVLVYYINNAEIVFAEEKVEVEQQLNNFIKINAPTQAKVGDEIELKVTTKPDSYVGVLGVDQSVLLLKGGNDLKEDEVFSALDKFKNECCGWNYKVKVPGHISGTISMTNAAYPKSEDYRKKALKYCSSRKSLLWGIENRVARIVSQSRALHSPNLEIKNAPEMTSRDFFPETWIWDYRELISESGEIRIRNNVPDTITSWILTGFSINTKSGLGITNQPHKLQVFQPFFISTNLPYSVKRGEVIAIPVIVFNYTNGSIKADLALDNTHAEFEFVALPSEVKSEIDTEIQQIKNIVIEPETGVSKTFLIRPKKVGQITLKISAISPVAGDTVKQILRVEPEGVTQFVNKAVFLDLKDQNEQTLEIAIEVPEDAVPDSTYVEVSVVGDLLGPTIENLDKLVRRPYGCGEQNMVNFVPNILVLKYLTMINKLTPSIEKMAKKFLEIGYQRELTYKHSDGSYSAFGKSDKNGSTWLTAYVARAFCEAKEFTNIDEKVIQQALSFLAKTQSANGSFPETGTIIDHHHVDKSGKDLSLTAFTLLAFLENKTRESHVKNKMWFISLGADPYYQGTINKGLEYLVKNIDDETDIYSLAISAYALQKAKHRIKDVILEKLNARQKKDGGHSWWTDMEPEKKDDCNYWSRPTNANIEITAYGLLAQLENKNEEETLTTLKWLIAQRNSNGGFSSTQDTVVGLQALIKFSEKCNVDKGDIEIKFSDDKGGGGTINVNDENATVVQTHVLSPQTRLVKINGKGTGSSLVQVSYRHNVDKRDDGPRFKIELEMKNTSKSDQMQLSVCTSFFPQGDEKTSNMAVMEISLPSGFVADQDNLNYIEEMERVKKVETKNGDSIVVIYFDYLDATNVCPFIKGFRTHRVAEQKPSAVVVYDYYDNSRQARAFYEINNTSLSEICDVA